MSFHDYHVMSSVHTSEHSVNIRTNSAFRKIRPSDNFCFRTYAILHCLNQIRIFYNFLVKTCFHHNICHHQIHKKIFKMSFLAQKVQIKHEWIPEIYKIKLYCIGIILFRMHTKKTYPPPPKQLQSHVHKTTRPLPKFRAAKPTQQIAIREQIELHSSQRNFSSPISHIY